MKKLVFIVLILLQVASLFSQNNKGSLAFELRYPIPSGNNYLNKGMGNGYMGLADLGIDFTFFRRKNFDMGLLLNTSALRLSESNVNLYILSPKIKFEYDININRISIIPNVAVGYSNWRFRSPESTVNDEFGNPVVIPRYVENYDGLTCRGATKLMLKGKKKINVYLQIAYEFTRLEKPEDGAVDSNYNRNMYLLYPGIGLEWRF